MKPLSEQDHYEILEIPRGTSQTEIERAYQLAQATYAEDSLAGYSVFAEGDAEAMRERIETAYRVLSNEESRRAYDSRLEVKAAAPESVPSWLAGREAETAAVKPLERFAPLEAFEEFDEEAGAFDGARLRRSRLRRGMEIEDVARVTKINPTYVRGFVSAYAACVGLDPRKVAESYMRRFDKAGPKQRRFQKRG